jgi:hypothetical protein
MNQNDDRIAHDPIEDDPVVGPIVRQAEEEAIADLAKGEFVLDLGYCHMLWDRQKKILKERYGINWKTPKACCDIKRNTQRPKAEALLSHHTSWGNPK